MTAAAATVVLALSMIPPFEAMKPELLPFSVSAYTDASGAAPYLGITASGKQTRDGICACGPSYEFYTLFVLPSGKILECQDRGGSITDMHLDMWTGDLRWALDVWERRELDVIVFRETKQ